MSEPRTIGEVMTAAPFTIDADAPLRLARKVLLREKIHNLPVVRRGRPIGVLTDRDMHLVAYLANDLMSDDDYTAGDLCVPNAYVVGPRASLDEVARNLAERRCGAVLIVEQGKLAGIFTTHDACRLLARPKRTRSKPLDRMRRAHPAAAAYLD